MAQDIDDGKTLRGYLSYTELHPEIRFRYRPVTFTERRKIINGLDDDGRRVIKLLCDKLVDWSLDCEIKAETVNTDNWSGDPTKGLHPNLVDPISNVVLGYRASDEDPDREVPEYDEQADAGN